MRKREDQHRDMVWGREAGRYTGTEGTSKNNEKRERGRERNTGEKEGKILLGQTSSTCTERNRGDNFQERRGESGGKPPQYRGLYRKYKRRERKFRIRKTKKEKGSSEDQLVEKKQEKIERK